jgi:hypothetical protein
MIPLSDYVMLSLVLCLSLLSSAWADEYEDAIAKAFPGCQILNWT